MSSAIGSSQIETGDAQVAAGSGFAPPPLPIPDDPLYQTGGTIVAADVSLNPTKDNLLGLSGNPYPTETVVVLTNPSGNVSGVAYRID